MADDLADLWDESEEAVDIQCDPFEMSDFPQTLVTEKVIFVIDAFIFDNDTDKECNISCIFSLLKLHMQLKKTTGIKPPKFECILYNRNAILHFIINNEKELHENLISIGNMEPDDDEVPLRINEIFDKIATLVELPDPDSLKKGLPPKWVYHVIWLFGRNMNIPTMQCTNSFDFLMMTPYFALDILYVYDQKLKGNQCEQIAVALKCLNENRKGYFFMASVRNEQDLFASLAQSLGHPLIRVPQIMARYNIVELRSDLEGEINIKNNNDNE